MRMKRKEISHPGERVLFQTRPRFMAHLSGTILKGIIIILILYYFLPIMALSMELQRYLEANIQLPIIMATYYFMIILMAILSISIIWDLLSWRQKSYNLTNQRVIVKSGVLRRKKSYIHYTKIQDIDIYQGLLDRIFFAGDMEIFGGHEHTSIILEDIPNPKEVEDMINRLIEGEEIDYNQKTGYRKKPKKATQRSIMEEYDKKFKL